MGVICIKAMPSGSVMGLFETQIEFRQYILKVRGLGGYNGKSLRTGDTALLYKY
jgi:hypothetical protein